MLDRVLQPAHPQVRMPFPNTTSLACRSQHRCHSAGCPALSVGVSFASGGRRVFAVPLREATAAVCQDRLAAAAFYALARDAFGLNLPTRSGWNAGVDGSDTTAKR